MSFLEALRAGVYGVTLTVPASYEILQDDDQANVIDRENGVDWQFLSAPMLDLDLEQLDTQRRDARSYAQHMFDQLRSKEAPPPSGHGVFISCERVTVADAPALSILHRLTLEPTKEIVMGHLLVPTGKGLFEARWLTRDGTTGTNALAADPDADPTTVSAALSRARAAERWIRDASGLRVVAPARAFPRGEMVLADLGCALVPPPRFVREAANKRFALFSRVSLAVTEGLHYFSIQRRREGDVARAVEDRTRDLIRADKMLATSVEVIAAPSGVGACVVARGERGENEARRYITAGMRDGSGSAVMTIICTLYDPVDDLVEELVATARTFRVAKPWWKIW